MKLLDGRELAGYIEERQARQVRALRQASHVFPKLAIVKVADDPVINSYVNMKQQYAEDILVETEIITPTLEDLPVAIERLNGDKTVHGIIVQLPLPNGADVEAILNSISPEKDVDGLGAHPSWTSATVLAIDWLLAGYNIELRGKKIAIVGNGRLVGQPLTQSWATMGLDVQTYDDQTADLPAEIKKAQVIVSATGVPGLVTSTMVQPGAVVVDAGTASENGNIVGDVASEVRERDDLTITPAKGGVGPLTVTALFDNVIRAAQATVI